MEFTYTFLIAHDYPWAICSSSFIVWAVKESLLESVSIHLYVQSAFGQTSSAWGNNTISGSSFNSWCRCKQCAGLCFTLWLWKRHLKFSVRKINQLIALFAANFTKDWSAEIKIMPLNWRYLTRPDKQALVPVYGQKRHSSERKPVNLKIWQLWKSLSPSLQQRANVTRLPLLSRMYAGLRGGMNKQGMHTHESREQSESCWKGVFLTQIWGAGVVLHLPLAENRTWPFPPTWAVPPWPDTRTMFQVMAAYSSCSQENEHFSCLR